MKQNIHPPYYPTARVICACGNTFTTGSTKPEIRVELCHKCHPFFTGQQKFVDRIGQIEKFQKKQAAATASPYQKKAKNLPKEEAPKSLKEMLKGIK